MLVQIKNTFHSLIYSSRHFWNILSSKLHKNAIGICREEKPEVEVLRCSSESVVRKRACNGSQLVIHRISTSYSFEKRGKNVKSTSLKMYERHRKKPSKSQPRLMPMPPLSTLIIFLFLSESSTEELHALRRCHTGRKSLASAEPNTQYFQSKFLQNRGQNTDFFRRWHPIFYPQCARHLTTKAIIEKLFAISSVYFDKESEPQFNFKPVPPFRCQQHRPGKLRHKGAKSRRLKPVSTQKKQRAGNCFKGNLIEALVL